MVNTPDPIQKSKRVYALAALLAPYVVRFVVSKTGLELHEDLLIVLNSSITEAISVGLASVLIAWSKITEKVQKCRSDEQ